MYTFDSRVRYSEIDHHETITLPGIINYFQDCSTFHSDSIGYGVGRLKSEGKAWILAYWQVVVGRYPGLGEQIKIGTWPTYFKGFLGGRNFQMTDEKGERVAWADSLWVYMDMEKGRPARPGKEELAAYGQEEPLPMEQEPRKIRPAKELTRGEPFRVGRHHIDTNEHVNNCQYVQMALEALEKDFAVRQVRVEYKRSAVYNDLIVPAVAEVNGRTLVELLDSEGEPYALVEFAGE